MGYAPKTRKGNLKIYILIFVIVLALSSFGVYYFMQNKEEEGKYSICGFSQKEMQSKIEKDFTQTYVVKDFVYYGESLHLYKNPYQVETSDEIAGKSIVLKDVCSDKEYAFVIGSQADRGILLSSLQNGYYEIFIIEDLVEKRVVFEQDVENSIQTIHRHNGKSKLVTLTANQNAFADSGITFPQKYTYIEVKEGKEETYDVVLDPSGMDHDFTYSLNKGGEGNGLLENEVTYEAATQIKKALEDKGLKVMIAKKDASEIVESYGEDGRLERAYKGKAKYYIRLSFAETDYGLAGLQITCSSHASDAFASQIQYDLKRNTATPFSQDAGVVDGLYESYPWEGIDGRSVYDSDLWVRESGGKATQAGMYSENAIKQNVFAKDNVYGMNAIHINLGYINNEADAQFYKQNKDAYIQSISDSILKFLNVEEGE